MDKNCKSIEAVRPIYFRSSLQSLREVAELPILHKNITSVINLMNKLKTRVEETQKYGDQEYEFIYLYRYISAFKRLVELPDFRNKSESYTKQKGDIMRCGDISKKYMSRLEKLQDILRERYEKQERLINERAKDYEKYCNKQKTADPPPEKVVREETSINTKSLFDLLNSATASKGFKGSNNVNSNNVKKLLIIDVRPRSHFTDSRVISNCISIPEEVISRGKSAAVIGSLLDSDTSAKWNLRGEFEKLVLMDWRSRLESLDSNSKLAILRDIMLKWDPTTSYKSAILVLDGGYEDLILRYPQVSTDPKVDIPSYINTPNSEFAPEFDYPMALLEDEKPVPPKPSPVSIPVTPLQETTSSTKQAIHMTVNRSTKPKVYANARRLTGKVMTARNRGEGDLSSSDDSNEMDSSVIEDSPEETVAPDQTGIISISSGESVIDEVNVKSVDLKKELDNLRKVKPPTHMETDKHVDSNEQDDEVKEEEEGDGDVIYSFLKEEGSSSNLRRSYSSPNVAKMDDEIPTTPAFSRANKPSEPRLPITSYIMGERTDSTYGKTALGLTGLKNFANNCYMNSIIQCLSNSEDLLRELVQFEKPKINTNNSPTRGRVANEVISTLRSLWSGEVKCYSLRELKNLMGCYQEIYRGSNHQDSHEFLIILLEYLHNDLNIPAEVTSLAGAEEATGEKAWGEFRRKNCSPIQRLFCGQERSTVRCATCGHSSITFGQFFQLAVPIPSSGRPPTLTSCIHLYLAGELIHGWQCPNCNAPRDAFKKIEITRLPPVLVIALKRFSQEGGSWLEKRESLVTYPLEGLSMREHTVPGSEQRYSHYNLYALSTHTGSLRAGHYRAIAKNHLNHKWYMFDDASIHPLSPQDVCNIPEVYILFYHAAK